MARLGLKNRLGILGGTFDPVHLGHLKLAEGARRQLGLEQVLFIPAYIPPHKRTDTITPAGVRLQMLELATRDRKYISVSSLEIEKKGISYTVETLRELRRKYPESEFYFIAGSDAVPELKTWKDVGKIFELCRFVIGGRPGFAEEEVPPQTIRLEGEFPDISSSGIRKMVREGRSVKEYLPGPVADYIIKTGLYA